MKHLPLVVFVLAICCRNLAVVAAGIGAAVVLECTLNRRWL